MFAVGLGLFMGSLLAMIRRLRRMSDLKERYDSILRHLFTVIPNIKYLPNQSQEDILAQRQTYFRSILCPTLRKARFIHIAGR